MSDIKSILGYNMGDHEMIFKKNEHISPESHGLKESMVIDTIERLNRYSDDYEKEIMLNELLNELTNNLGERDLDLVLNSLIKIDNKKLRADAFSKIVAVVPKIASDQALKFIAILREKEENEGLSPLPITILKERLDILENAKKIEDNKEKALAIANIALRLPKDEKISAFNDALDIILKINDDNVKAYILSQLISKVPETMLGKVLEISNIIQEERQKEFVLNCIISRLDYKVLTNNQIESAGVMNKGSKLSSSIEIPPLDNNESQEILFKNALMIINNFEDKYDRISGLSLIVIFMRSLHPAKFYFFWKDLLYTISSRTRKDLLDDLCILILLIDDIGGEKAAIECINATRDVCRWWQ
jgi:hypothetical protein